MVRLRRWSLKARITLSPRAKEFMKLGSLRAAMSSAIEGDCAELDEVGDADNTGRCAGLDFLPSFSMLRGLGRVLLRGDR